MEEANEKLSRFLLEAQMRISRERGGKRVSQSEMARIAGIPQGSYSKYETGSSPPGPENARRLADAFGPQVYDILGMPRAMPDDPELEEIAELWMYLPSNYRKKFTQALKSAVVELDIDVNNISTVRG